MSSGRTKALIGLGALAGIAALVGLTSLHKVPSGSMLPTIPVGAHVFTNRFAGEPAPGEMILFRFPENPEQLFIKRVVARGGDVIEVRDGRPSVNGVAAWSCPVGKVTASRTVRGFLVVERLGGHTYLVLHDSDHVSGRVQGPWKVPAGEVWVLGDNRDNAHDSRSWRGGLGGGVSSALIKGRVIGLDGVSLPEGSAPELAAKLEACLAQP